MINVDAKGNYYEASRLSEGCFEQLKLWYTCMILCTVGKVWKCVTKTCFSSHHVCLYFNTNIVFLSESEHIIPQLSKCLMLGLVYTCFSLWSTICIWITLQRAIDRRCGGGGSPSHHLFFFSPKYWTTAHCAHCGCLQCGPHLWKMYTPGYCVGSKKRSGWSAVVGMGFYPPQIANLNEPLMVEKLTNVKQDM